MYLEHYGLAEAPFRITPHTDFFFSGANRGETLEALLYAITHDEGIVKISGEVGSGKTMLCRVLMERLPERVVIIYLANPSLSREDILYALADELGIVIPDQSRNSVVLRLLQEKLVSLYAANKQVVVLIDEAHAMPMETLEEIRLLSNLETNRRKLLQLVMFGQPELDEILARSDMRQLHDRITHHFRLDPLIRDDVATYLDFRMSAAGYRGPTVFAPAAVRLIAEASQGLTRRINILADKALLAAFAAGKHLVDAREAKAAIRDSGRVALQPRSGWQATSGALWAGAGALLMAAAFGGWKFLAPQAGEATMPAVLATAPVPEKIPNAPPRAPEGKPAPRPTVHPEPAPPTLEGLLVASQPWLQSVPDQHWFLQLQRTNDDRNPAQLESFIVSALGSGLPREALRAYHFKDAQGGRFGVIYGDYESRQEALKALESLPAEVRRVNPYPRQAIRLKPGGGAGS